MIGVDLFAGAGGLTQGAKSAGITVRSAVEFHHAASATFSQNHPEVSLYSQDITTIRDLDVGVRDQELVLFGGPPCQGFSTSNQRTRHRDNPRNWLFLEFLRFVRSMQPDWVVFENVAGVLQTDGGSFILSFESELRSLGYQISSGTINSFDYGIPQKRSRFFSIAARNGSPPSSPVAEAERRFKLKDAIDDLPELLNGACEDMLSYRKDAESPYAKALRGDMSVSTGHLVSRNADEIVARYPFIPQGGNWKNVPGMMREGFDDRRRYHTGIYRRLREDEPSVVIGNFRKNMLIHPTQNRGLSVREAARIQSFPDNYKFAGSIGFQQQQVGNAVPPLLAEAVFNAILAVN